MRPVLILLVLSLLTVQCANRQYGKRVKEPFTGNSYESNNRFFRATGKGVSNSENVAKGKADIQAKSQLAGQVNTRMKQVTDQYMSQNENERAADLSEKFESLVRQTMNTSISDLRKIGEKKFYNGEEYTVFIAYEIKKNAMFRFLKKQAKADKRFNEAEQKAIEEIISKEIEELEKED